MRVYIYIHIYNSMYVHTYLIINVYSYIENSPILYRGTNMERVGGRRVVFCFLKIDYFFNSFGIKAVLRVLCYEMEPCVNEKWIKSPWVGVGGEAVL